MARTPPDLTVAERDFLSERHLGTLTTLRTDGSPHVVAIAFTYHDGLVRVISSESTQKVKNVDRSGYAAICQVDGRRWLTLEGPALVDRTSEGVADAVAAFESRYRPVRENPDRVAIALKVERVMGSA